MVLNIPSRMNVENKTERLLKNHVVVSFFIRFLFTLRGRVTCMSKGVNMCHVSLVVLLCTNEIEANYYKDKNVCFW